MLAASARAVTLGNAREAMNTKRAARATSELAGVRADRVNNQNAASVGVLAIRSLAIRSVVSRLSVVCLDVL